MDAAASLLIGAGLEAMGLILLWVGRRAFAPTTRNPTVFDMVAAGVGLALAAMGIVITAEFF